MYTEAMIKEDLQEAASLLNQKKFPYLRYKNYQTQQVMLLSLFHNLTKPNSIRKLKSIPHGVTDLKKMLTNLDMIGGQNREMKYMNIQWTKGLRAQKACFMRACQLGHIDIIKKMIKKGFDVREIVNEATGDTALHIAVKNKHYEIVELLLKQNAHIDAKNNDKATPIAIAQELNEPLMVTTLKTKQYIKPPQIELSNYVAMTYKRLGKQDTFMSKTWFTHKFSDPLRRDQKEFLQLIIDRHLAKTMGGHTEDAIMLVTALDMIEQSMWKNHTSVASSPSRLQTIINNIKESIGPVELTVDDKRLHAEKIKDLLSRRKLSDTFQVYMSRYDPTWVAPRIQPTYRSAR